MSGRYGSSSVSITYDDSPGGTARAVSNFVMNLGGAKIVVDTEESHAFGDAWREFSANGMRNVPDIPVSGFWDTTADVGPHAAFRVVDADCDPNGGTRELVIVFGDGKTFTVQTILAEYSVNGNNGKLTGFEAVIRPTGAAVWS